jgi:hypothetical protein
LAQFVSNTLKHIREITVLDELALSDAYPPFRRASRPVGGLKRVLNPVLRAESEPEILSNNFRSRLTVEGNGV